MNLENFFSFVQVRKVYVNLAVKTSGAQQGFIQNVYAVGGSQNDDTAVGAETIHFRKKLVQCVLSFVIAAHGRILSTCSSHSVNLVYKNDTWRFLLGLSEQVTYTTGTDTDKHFHEIRSGH